MNLWQQWGLGVCTAAAAAFLVEAAAPGGRLGETLKTVCSLFLLLAILAPLRQAVLASAVPGNSRELAAFSAVEGQALERRVFAAQAEQRVRRVVVDKLEEKGIKPVEVLIHIAVDGQQAALEPVGLCLRPEQRPLGQDAVGLLKELGLEAAIRYQGEDDPAKGQGRDEQDG